MDTTDRVLLIILTTLLSIFFILCIAVVVAVFKLVQSAKNIVERADEVLLSVENATETASKVLRQTSNKKALLSVAKTIYDLAQKGRK